MPLMGFISRLDTARERVSKLEDVSVETSQTEIQKKQTNKQTKKMKKERHKPKPRIEHNIRIMGGVPIMAQWLTNLTRNHEVVGLIPGLTQWVEHLALL